MSEEQQRIVDFAATGRNIFYTDSAGSGKTRVLNAIRARLDADGNPGKLKVRVMAPTCKAALAIEGTTTWSFAGLRPDDNKKTLESLQDRTARNKHTRKRFNETGVIIIDEISMVENLHLERINAVMQAGRGKYDEPFGGVQVILIGDFFQLPPVKPFQHCAYCGSPFRTDWEDGEDSEDTVVNYTCDSCKDFIMYRESDKWTFQSQVWEQCKFRHIELTTAHRQKDNAFVSLLQKCRKSIPFSQDEIDVLMNHPSDTKGAVKLFSTRAEVRQTNTAEFAKLSSVARCYTCHDQFVGEHIYNTARFREDENGSLKYFGRDHRFEKTIELILKMQVVLLANLNLRKGLCNGSQGVVVDFEAYDEEKLPRKSLDGTPSGGLVGEHASLMEAQIRAFARKQQHREDFPG